MAENDNRSLKEQYVDRVSHLSEVYSGIRAVRPLPPKAFREDGAFQNVLTKYGTQKDSSEYYTYESDGPVTDMELSEFYEQDGLFARIIDAPAEEAVKHGFELKDVDEGVQDFINECLDELDWEETAILGLKWARLYGGSIAVMLINDGRDLDEPLDWKHIRSIDDIRIYDRSVVTPDYASMFKYDNQDPFKTRSSRLGYPERYMVSSKTGTFTVHETRCLIFQNGVLPENTPSALYQFWGVPEYVRVHRAIRDVEVAHGMAPKLLDRSVQAIYKMRDLEQTLALDGGEDIVLKRLSIIDMARGLLNSMVLDADGEDYDFKSFSYAGVSDVINTTCNYLSALTNIPQTILFGRSPAGMNATGTSDFENYYNYVERIQKRMLRSNLRYLLSVICQAAKRTGELKKVPKIKVEFNALWSMSEQERTALDQQKAQISMTKAQTAVQLVQGQILDPSEVRKEYAKDEEFEIDTMLDDYTEEELEENDPSQQGEGMGGDPMAAMMGGGAPGGGAPGGMPDQPGFKIGNGTKVQTPAAEKAQGDAGEDAVAAYRKRRAERLAARGIGGDGNSPDAAPEATKLPQDMQDDSLTKDEVNEDEEEIVPKKNYGGVGVLVIQGDRILTATRIAGDAGGYGMFCGPGGHIEEGETPEQAAIRETREEFGIDVGLEGMTFKKLGVIHDDDDEVQKSHIFIARGFAGEISCDDQEMRRPVWRTLEDIGSIEEKAFQPFRDSLNLLLDRMYRYDEEANDLVFSSVDEVIDNL